MESPGANMSGTDSSIDSQTHRATPMQTSADPNVAANNRSNSFSIENILSSSKPSLNQEQALMLEHLNMMHQQQEGKPSARAAPSATSNPIASSQNTGLAQIPHFAQAQASAPAGLTNGLAKLNETQQQQQQQQNNPNFLYFMAYMLLQQQQQQQAALRHQQQQQLQKQQQQQQQQQMNPIDFLAQLTARASCAPGSMPSVPSSLGGGPFALGHKGQAASKAYQQAAVYSPLMSLHQVLASGPTAPPQPLDIFQQQQQQQQRQQSPAQLGAPVSQAGNSGGAPSKQPRFSLSPKMQKALSDTKSHQHEPFAACVNHLQARPHHQNSHPATRAEKQDNLKPAHSYIGLIGMCILSTPEKRMVLNDIYQYILDHYPYYRNRGSGWRNSVRHNLSLNECFQKAGRAANGKGHYWTIHPANMDDFMNGDFRRRRAQRKVRRWNHMDVPSDESDDESTEDANRPPLPEHFKRSLEMHRRLEVMGFASVDQFAPLPLPLPPGPQVPPPRQSHEQRQQGSGSSAIMIPAAPATAQHQHKLAGEEFMRAAATLAAAAVATTNHHTHRHEASAEAQEPTSTSNNSTLLQQTAQTLQPMQAKRLGAALELSD